MEIGGVPHVCGAYSVTDAQLNAAVNTMLRRGSVSVDDVPAIRGLRFWNRVGRAMNPEALLGRTASCAPVPAEVVGQGNFRLSFGNSAIRN